MKKDKPRKIVKCDWAKGVFELQFPVPREGVLVNAWTDDTPPKPVQIAGAGDGEFVMYHGH